MPRTFSQESLVSLCRPPLVRQNQILTASLGSGDDVKKLFEHCQQKGFAIPALNVTSSSTVVAALEAARDAKSPVILQFSNGGAAYFAGKGVANKQQEGSIAGAIAGALYVRSIAPTYGIPVVLHTDHCAKELLPWLDGMLDQDEKYFKEHGEPLFSSRKNCPN